MTDEPNTERPQPNTKAPRRRRKLLIAAALVCLPLFVGYIRLPFAAIASLKDYHILADKDTLYMDAARSDVSPIQQAWLKLRVPQLKQGQSMPSVYVDVRWNWLFIARVKSGHLVGPVCAENRDTLYLWCLGAWIPVLDLSYEMA
ncbi:MAG: hypothetical protein GY851_16080 [bacterium]|nr:hypothetical protein [bacterium]